MNWIIHFFNGNPLFLLELLNNLGFIYNVRVGDRRHVFHFDRWRLLGLLGFVLGHVLQVQIILLNIKVRI